MCGRICELCEQEWMLLYPSWKSVKSTCLIVVNYSMMFRSFAIENC